MFGQGMVGLRMIHFLFTAVTNISHDGHHRWKGHLDGKSFSARSDRFLWYKMVL